MDIGDRIRILRTSSGMTQEELANYLHITKQAVYKYETKLVTNIPMDKIAQMSQLFNVSPSKIMGWDKKIITRDEVNNRIEIVQRYKNYSPHEICDMVGVSENEYEKLIAHNFTTNDTTLANLSEKSGFSIDFLNGLGYTTQKPIDQWYDDYQQDYFIADDFTKIIIEHKVGAPVYKTKMQSDNTTASLSDLKLAILDVIDQIPEEQQRAFLEMAKIYRDSLKKD